MKKLFLLLSFMSFDSLYGLSFEKFKAVVHDMAIEQSDASGARCLRRLATCLEKGFKNSQEYANYLRERSELYERRDLSSSEKLLLLYEIKKKEPDYFEKKLKNGLLSLPGLLSRAPVMFLSVANMKKWDLIADMTRY